MEKERRTIYYDSDLDIEAYSIFGMIPRFTTHFHNEYVIGFLESGRRKLNCKGSEYVIYPGDMVIFNPRDNHACQQIEEYPLNWRCINVKPSVMEKTAYEIAGVKYLPYFEKTVILQSELTVYLQKLHYMITKETKDFQKEETFFFFMESLIGNCGRQERQSQKEVRTEIQEACTYLEKNYNKNISLDELSALTRLSKYYFLRSFTKEQGISPYKYLETLRIDKGKQMLEQGSTPGETALETGFTDQSHFTRFFKDMIGLTPMQYRKIFNDTNEMIKEDKE